jgi:ElaB/YqjD/DUF883 family membrane-anchored ribosome-binding protein
MATKQAAETTSSEDVAAQIETIRADIATLAASISKLAGEEIGSAQERLRDKAASAQERGEQLADSARKQAQANVRRVEDVVQENPFGAILVAIGLGFLVGMFTRR